MIQYTCDRCRTPIEGTPVDYTNVHERTHVMERMSAGVAFLIPEKFEKGFHFRMKHLCGHCLIGLSGWFETKVLSGV